MVLARPRAISSHPRRLSHYRQERAEREWLGAVRIWAAAREDCLWLDKVVPLLACRVAGVVERLRVDPLAAAIETTITDGDERLVARWDIVPSPPQLRAVPGLGLILEGVPRIGASGGLVMVEPDFEIVAGPRHG